VVGIVASFQCAEAIKFLTGNHAALSRDLISLDVWENRFQRLRIAALREVADCPCCVHRRFDYLRAESTSQTVTLCGRNSVQITFPAGHAVDFEDVAARLARAGTVQRNPFLLRCAVDQYELTLFKDGRVIVQGTKDPAVARTVCAKYVGA
jgi:adenylyltransferase/sulfurtransferase